MTTETCDRCRQPKPLPALFAFTYGPQPWDANEYTAILCVPCHSASAEQAARIEALSIGAVDSPSQELELAWLEAALHNTVLAAGKARAAANRPA